MPFCHQSTLELHFEAPQGQPQAPMFWIDALCIDQDNLKESDHQIQQMDGIYKNAFLVLTWLGKTPIVDAMIRGLFQDETCDIDLAGADRTLADGSREFSRLEYWSRFAQFLLCQL
jgi:hypothetical protein